MSTPGVREEKAVQELPVLDMKTLKETKTDGTANYLEMGERDFPKEKWRCCFRD